MNLDHYRRALLALEQKLVQRVGAEVATARDARDDQPDVSDLAHVDELKNEYLRPGRDGFGHPRAGACRARADQ